MALCLETTTDEDGIHECRKTAGHTSSTSSTTREDRQHWDPTSDKRWPKDNR